VKSLAYINYAENIEPVISKELDQEISDLLEEVFPFSPGDVSKKKANLKSSFKGKIPLCNWTMPTQPDGYIRAGKYDFL